MLTEMQRGIIKSVSTILFQDDKEGAKYWLRDVFNLGHPYKSVSIDDGDDASIKYNLFTIMVGNDVHIAVEVLHYDEYGDMIDCDILGTVRINQDKARWDMVKYVCIIESIIENQLR